MAIDIRGMRSFVAVASAGSISRAAENLHIAQPALSLQIKNIEDHLGVQLFDRTPKGVTPTAAGARFLLHAIDILKRIDVAYEDVRDAVNEPSGRVALGLPQSMAKILTVPLVSEILRRWPKIQFQMIELSTGYIPNYLVNGHIDIGLTFGVDEGAGLRCTHLVDEDLVLVTSPAQLMGVLGGDVSGLEEIRLAELQRFPMILPTGTHSLRSRIDEFLAGQRLSLKVIAEVNTIPQLIELAAAGVGSTILSYASVSGDCAAERLATLRIIEPRLFRPVYLCRSATAPLSIATALVRDLITDTVKTMVASGAWPTGGDNSSTRQASRT
jgi:LysR family transcriptional regulator, nitrogen assimilation regulatory protein